MLNRYTIGAFDYVSFTSVSLLFCRVDYQGVMLHEDYASMMPEVESLRCSAQDILLASFQKSGLLNLVLVPFY